MCIAALLPGSAFSFSWQKKFVAQCQEVGSPAHLQASSAVLVDLNLYKFFLVPSSTEVQQNTWTQGPVPKGLRMGMVSMSLSNCR